ncbi:hypothetical protein P3T40_001074 [Paraburkholderia sp. EB58]|jgi:hypothetical protein
MRPGVAGPEPQTYASAVAAGLFQFALAFRKIISCMVESSCCHAPVSFAAWPSSIKGFSSESRSVETDVFVGVVTFDTSLPPTYSEFRVN